MTPKHLNILRHALGLDDNGRGNQYRNHFLTGPESSDWDDCNALVSEGMMTRFPPREIFGGDFCFLVTAAGRCVVNAAAPPPLKLSRGRRRYLAFLNADCGLKFGEWLKTRWAKEACR